MSASVSYDCLVAAALALSSAACSAIVGVKLSVECGDAVGRDRRSGG